MHVSKILKLLNHVIYSQVEVFSLKKSRIRIIFIDDKSM